MIILVVNIYSLEFCHRFSVLRIDTTCTLTQKKQIVREWMESNWRKALTTSCRKWHILQRICQCWRLACSMKMASCYALHNSLLGMINLTECPNVTGAVWDGDNHPGYWGGLETCHWSTHWPPEWWDIVMPVLVTHITVQESRKTNPQLHLSAGRQEVAWPLYHQVLKDHCFPSFFWILLN